MRICIAIKSPILRIDRKSLASRDTRVHLKRQRKKQRIGTLCSLTQLPNHRPFTHATLIKRQVTQLITKDSRKREIEGDEIVTDRDFHDRTRSRHIYFIGRCVKPMCRKMKIVLTSRNQLLIEFKFKYLG